MQNTPINLHNRFQESIYLPTKQHAIETIKDSTNNNLFEFLSKRNMWSRFFEFLGQCTDLYPKMSTLINKIHKSSKKTDNNKSLDKVIADIEKLFSNQEFIRRLSEYSNTIETENMLSKELFADGTFDGLKNLVIAKIRKNKLSYKAMNELKKQEILDILQIKNKFKDSNGNMQHILDVSGHGTNRTYTLGSGEIAQIRDNTLDIISKKSNSELISLKQENDSQVNSYKPGENEIDGLTALQEEEIMRNLDGNEETESEGVISEENSDLEIFPPIDGTKYEIYPIGDGKVGKIADYNLDDISNESDSIFNISEETNEANMLSSVSGTTYKQISKKKKLDFAAYNAVNVLVNEKSSFLIQLNDGTLFDSCKGSDQKEYKIIDYISATENTGRYINTVRVQDVNRTKILRLIGIPGSKECFLETEITIQKVESKFKKFLLNFLDKEPEIKVEEVLELVRNSNERRFEYTTITGRIVTQHESYLRN